VDFRSCWIVFINIVQGHPDSLIQFSKGEAVIIFLASVLSGIHAMSPNREKCRAWTKVWLPGCPSHIIIPHMVVPYALIQFNKGHFYSAHDRATSNDTGTPITSIQNWINVALKLTTHLKLCISQVLKPLSVASSRCISSEHDH